MYSFLTFYYPAISDLLIIICKNSKKGFKMGNELTGMRMKRK